MGTLEVGDEAGAHLVPGGDRAWSQVQEPGACPVLERHGKPVRHDLLVSVGSFDAQLVELEELRRVSRAVVARRQVLHVPTCRSWVLTCESRSMVATCWSRERPGSFLRARDFLEALLLLRWHLTERVQPRGHAPCRHSA